MKNLGMIFGGIAVLLIILSNGFFFVLTPGKQAIITEFGKPVKGYITEAGLHMKMPFIQEVRLVDKRILTWDGFPTEIPTRDKKYIKVDTTARWKVTDALTFIQTVRNERGAKARLDAVLDATTRDVISNNNLVEAVRNSNAILDEIAKRRAEIDEKKKKGEAILDEEVTGEIEKIAVGREQLSAQITKEARKNFKSLESN